MTAAVLLLLIPLAVDEISSDHAASGGSVAAGREALDRGWLKPYPWYDAQTDDLRRVVPPAERDWSWLWNWLDDVGAWFRDLWPNWNWSWPFRFPRTPWQWIAWIVFLALIGLLVYAVIRAYRLHWSKAARAEARAKSRGKKSSAAEDAQRIASLPFPIHGGSSDFLSAARKCYEQGDYGRAIIFLFSYQLLQLDRQRIIRLARGKTNRQYLREVGPRRPLGRLLAQTMVAFEDVFFGSHSLDRGRFELCWSRIDEFESLSKEP
jgi:hypothetical protein